METGAMHQRLALWRPGQCIRDWPYGDQGNASEIGADGSMWTGRCHMQGPMVTGVSMGQGCLKRRRRVGVRGQLRAGPGGLEGVQSDWRVQQGVRKWEFPLQVVPVTDEAV